MRTATGIIALAILFASFQACGTDGGGGGSPDVPTGPCKFNSQCGIGYLCIDGNCYYDDAGPFIPGKDGGSSHDGGGQDASVPDAGAKDAGTQSCTLGTCPGCCNAYELCFGGTLDTACGQNNGQCQDCTLNNFICKNHVCVNPSTTCSFGSCTGCCDVFDTCQKGSTNTQCGSGGIGCQDCTMFSQTCKSGSCSF